MFGSNKDRIYVALYARGGQDPNTYHWAIIIGPKNEVEGGQGGRYHVKHDPLQPGESFWKYEDLPIPLTQTASLLARVTIGKVTDKSRLERVLKNVPLVQGDPAWTCRVWVRDAIAALVADGKCLGTSVTDWTTVEQACNNYVGEKRAARRYDGSGSWKAGTVPTYDLLERKETIP